MYSKVPPCPHARVAGANGQRLARASFAATLKLSNNLENFQNLRDEVENASIDCEELTGAAKFRKILDKLRENESKELQPMMNRWE